MPKHHLDQATDSFLCSILRLPEPNEDLEPYLTSIGYDEPDVDKRRQVAHKLIQKYLNEFKTTQTKPVTKFKLIGMGVSPEIADLILEPLNKFCVKYGITTEKRVKIFLDLCIEFSNGFFAPNPLYLPITGQEDYSFVGNDIEVRVEETCKLWADLSCNFFADRDAISQIRRRLFG